MCMIDDSERVEMLREGWRNARKDHRCKECGRTINSGERYHLDVFVSDGEVTSHKSCAHCMVVREWLAAECGGWLFGFVEEDAAEHVSENPRHYGSELLRAVVGMRRHWRSRKGRLLPVPGPIRTTEMLLEAQP